MTSPLEHIGNKSENSTFFCSCIQQANEQFVYLFSTGNFRLPLDNRILAVSMFEHHACVHGRSLLWFCTPVIRSHFLCSLPSLSCDILLLDFEIWPQVLVPLLRLGLLCLILGPLFSPVVAPNFTLSPMTDYLRYPSWSLLC